MDLRDEQNNEMVQIVRSIADSDVGMAQLDKIYQEADVTGQGRGTLLKSVWDSDVEMFFAEQMKNSELCF